jgi:malonate decarboxylase gamma subunit
MLWTQLVEQLFGSSHTITATGSLLAGTAEFDGTTLSIVGSTDHAPIGYEMALRQARVVLDTMALHPGRPILILVDTQGQQLRRRDELLGINRAMAHLACTVDLARRRGHRTVGLVYDQALSGGFLSTGLIADACDALPEAEIRVMGLPAMARVTKIAQARLAELAQSNPVFAPGVQNYVAMGGVRSLWVSELRQCLRDALASASTSDERARLGEERGGRSQAASVVRQVLADAACR